MFPIEIWEKILGYTEAITLVQLRAVNSSWNSIITKYLQESDSWFKQCKQDIPQKYWLILLENSFYLNTLFDEAFVKNEYNKYNYKIWIRIYKAWIKWQNVQDFNIYTVDEFSPIPDYRPSERITCMTVLGDLVAVGSTEGFIRIFDLSTNKPLCRFDQLNQIMDIKLFNQGKNNKFFLIATSIDNNCKIWNISTQKGLMTMSGDVICVGYKYCCITLLPGQIDIYKIAAVNCFPTRLYIQDLNIIELTQNYCNFISNMKFVNMIINNYQINFWSKNGFYCVLDLREIDDLSKSFFVTYIGVPKNEKVRNYYLFNPHTLFCITERGHLGISVNKDKWQMYNVFPFLQGLVSAVLFAVRILVLGLDSGDIWLFSVENELGLKSINFQSKKSKKIHVSSEPIVSVNLMEISEDQRLLVATKSTVYHIELKNVIV